MRDLTIEVQRHNISAKQFYSYCQRQAQKKGLSVEEWLEYEDWAKPISPCNIHNKHEDWDIPKYEICKHLPYEAHYYMEDSYCFIMEWEDSIGYLWIWEHRD